MLVPELEALREVRVTDHSQHWRRRARPLLRDVVALPLRIAFAPALGALALHVAHEGCVSAPVAADVLALGLGSNKGSSVRHGRRLELQSVVPPVARVVEQIARLHCDLATKGLCELLVRPVFFAEGVDSSVQEVRLRIWAKGPLLLANQLRLPGRGGSAVLMQEHRGALLSDEEELPLDRRVEVVDRKHVRLVVLAHALRDPLLVTPEDLWIRQWVEVLLQPLPTAQAEPELHIPRDPSLLLKSWQGLLKSV
mmetsp:Transcript_74/g.170  ORF Transcript_74/g.170 Transcript_74/m.170 type:complete len:253 (-) Transcript_74:233-991(-)